MASAEPITNPSLPRASEGSYPISRGVPPSLRLPPIAQAIGWALAPTLLMERCARELGPHFTLNFPRGFQLVLVSGPDAVKRVFTAPPEVAPSAAANSPVAPVMGPNSVITLTGPEHMRQRRLLLPPFHGERMREYSATVVEATRRELRGWPLERPMAVQPAARRITLEVILRAVFGVTAERMGPLSEAIADLLRPAGTVLVMRALFSRDHMRRPVGDFAVALARLDALLYEEISLRRAEPDLFERSDILSLLMQALDEEGRAMSDQELRDELVTLLIAGHETTATTVSWAFERLVRHPAALARLLADLDAGEHAYIDAVVNETLRVRPVLPIVVRLLADELDVGGRVLPAGTRVAPCIYLTNRSPDVYADPNAFRPERFLESSPETFAWIPFGGGIRRCIGASFAQLEARLILATILEQLEPRLPRSARDVLMRRGEPVRRRAITFVPAAGARVSWRPRAGARA